MSIRANLYKNNFHKSKFSFGEKQPSPFYMFEKEVDANKETKYMPVYKPNLFTKTWAFLAKTKAYIGGTLQGSYYGLIIGLPAAIAGFMTTRVFSANAITKSILYPSAIVGAFIGMKGIDPGDHAHNHNVGIFERIWSLLKGSVMGAGFGLMTGAASALLVNTMKTKSGPAFKTILAVSTLTGAAIGCFISRFAANKRVSEIYFTMGANKNLTGEE